jgi:DNA-directed RNA polymerase specialized sigma24 family protein
MNATSPVLDAQGPAALSPATIASCASPGLSHVHSIIPADGLAGFRQQLAAIREDPQIRSLALRFAGARDLAEDALQSAYCSVGKVKHPERLKNLRAYFVTVLRNEVCGLYAPQQAIPLANPEDVLDLDRRGIAVCGPTASRPVDETVSASLQAQSWLKRLATERNRLLAAVPGRSDDPNRYGAVIYDAAEHLLRDAINGEPSDADSNDTFRAAYPEYFNQPGAAVNTCHQRFRRAREDVKALLQAVVRRDELT